MSERVKANGRGIHRFRAVFFSDGTRLSSLPDTAEAERLAKQRLRTSVQQRQAASFLIADCRLADPKNPVLSLFPKDLRVRLVGGATAVLAEAQAPRQRAVWRVILPWAAALATAGAGFWVFLMRAL
jgi:hypothetical protein